MISDKKQASKVVNFLSGHFTFNIGAFRPSARTSTAKNITSSGGGGGGAVAATTSTTNNNKKGGAGAGVSTNNNNNNNSPMNNNKKQSLTVIPEYVKPKGIGN